MNVNSIKISYDIAYVVKYFETIAFNTEFKHSTENEKIIERTREVKISLTPQRKNKIIILGKRNYNMKLIQALVKSFWYNKLGAEGKLTNAIRNGYYKKIRNLRFLPANLIESIINEIQDPELNVKKLIAMGNNL